MQNFDQNKAAQPKISKKVKSVNNRIKRKRITSDMPNFNKNICDECGFHIRGENHVGGSHHNRKGKS